METDKRSPPYKLNLFLCVFQGSRIHLREKKLCLIASCQYESSEVYLLSECGYTTATSITNERKKSNHWFHSACRQQLGYLTDGYPRLTHNKINARAATQMGKTITYTSPCHIILTLTERVGPGRNRTYDLLTESRMLV